MSYVVDYGALDSLDSSIFSQCSQWQSQLGNVESAVSVLMGTANLSGNSANNIKNYLKSVHSTVISLLGELIYLHSCNFKVYKSDYQAGVDTDLHAVISSEKLTEIQEDLRTYRDQAASVDDQLAYVLRDVRDIFSITYSDIYSADNANRIAENYVKELDQQIQQLEAAHSGQDFEATEALITSLTTFLNEQMARPAGMLTGFDIMQLAASGSFASLYEAHNLAYDQITNRQGAFEIAMENDAQRAEALLKEYEERQKTATTVKWIVTGACVIGSIVAIAATGGAATPLVVGAVSAASGAIMAGANNLADQYVQHGNLIENADKIDWGSFGKETVLAGVAGFATGAIGAGVGGAITSKLSSTAIGNTLLHSGSNFVRIGTAATIGSVSEMGSGIVTRGVGTFITTEGNLGKALDDALDMKNIAFDAALGGAGGAINEYTTTKEAQKAADDFASSYNQKHNPLKDGEDYGLENLKQTANGGVDFSDSDYILRTEAGEPIQVKIKATGDRSKDYKLAEQILKDDYGIDIDFKSMRTGSDKTHVWHHLDDYNVATNETTMQFIEVDAHKAIKTHAGSAKQYHIANGTGYGKDSFDVNYGLDLTDEMSTVKDGVMDNLNNIANTPSMSSGSSFNFRLDSLNLDGLNNHFSSIGNFSAAG